LTQLPTERDSSIVLARYAMATERVGLGSYVFPIYARHPTAMAQMAATLDELSGGRFRLGIGVSHKVTVEGMWGLSLDRPVDAMREYVAIVRGLLAEGSASVEGEHFTARAAYGPPRRPDLPILIAALNPRMLELAGEVADGVALWMCSPGYIDREVIPRLRAGRERVGKGLDGFEVVAALDASLTTNVEGARGVFRGRFERYASLPYYRSMLDASGYAGALASGEIPDGVLHELAGMGDEHAVREAIRRYRDAGCTLPLVGPFAQHEGAAGFEPTLRAAFG
ncbi:MAG TPA: LLM class flavin-dependent oxidoreductase, partial [Candidatus Dormibacteraeota bacterium]|nr:LLM class flavin-dependent oxidoreductase [Candidatus Dormibacteraeota bacterium]